MTAVKVGGVSFRYDRDPVLTDVSFDLPERSFLVIIGPNGGGKSTLLKLLLGLLPLQKGEISIWGLPAGRAGRYVGYVPQDTERIKNFPISALDTVMMPFYRPGFPRRKKADIVKEAEGALDMMGARDLAGLRLNEISAGQRQRVLLARALASKPRLLVLDEPISAIDPAGQKMILDMFKQELGDVTIILVSHDLSVIPGNATAIACVNRTVFYHPSGELTAEVISEAYGDVASVTLIQHEWDRGRQP